MTREEYRSNMMAAYRALVMAASLPLDEMAEAINHADTVGPLLDPTLWMRQSPKMREDLTVINALRIALKTLPDEMQGVVKAMRTVAAARKDTEVDRGQDQA